MLNKAKFLLDFNFKAVAQITDRNGVPGIYIEGDASTWEQDRDGEFVDKRAFDGGTDAYFKMNPILLYSHGTDPQIAKKPLGEVVQHKVTKTGLWIKAFIPVPEETFAPMLQVFKSIQNGTLKTFSIGGIFERVKNVITNVQLFEISVEPVQSNPTALFAVATKAFDPDNLKDAHDHGIAEEIARGRFHSERWRITDILGMALHKLYNDSEMKPKEQAAKAEEIISEFGTAIIKLFKNQKASGLDVVGFTTSDEKEIDQAEYATILELCQKWGIPGDDTAASGDAKAGRVLSKANETALTNAVEVIRKILDKLKKDPVTTETIKD